MVTNNFEIVIDTPIEKVWNAITNTYAFTEWMKSVRVETDWKEGSEITYTCYEENGQVLQWQGMNMIWHGIIKSLVKNKEFTCVYPSKTTGLLDESYFLESLNNHQTKLIQTQTLISQEVADGYKDGVLHSLDLLKVYLENLDA